MKSALPNIKIALPLLISNVAVIGCSLISAKIVSYSDLHNWFILGLFLPINYIILGLLESSRVCSIRGISLMYHQDQFFNLILFLVFSYTFIILILSMVIKFIYYSHITFLVLYTLAYIPVISNSISNASLFVTNKAKSAMSVIIFTSIVSVLLTYLMNKYCNVGINAIILSTISAYTLGTLISILIVLRGCKIFVRLKQWKHFSNVLIKSGLPVFLTYLSLPIGLFLINKIFSDFGEAAISSFSIDFRIQSFFILPAIAIGVAAGILINQSRLNDYNFHNANIKISIILSFLIYVPMALILYFIKDDLSTYFTQDSLTQHLISQYFTYFSMAYVFICPLFSIMVIWEQTGRAYQSLLINILILLSQILIAGGMAIYTHHLEIFYPISAGIGCIVSMIVICFFMFRTKLTLVEISYEK